MPAIAVIGAGSWGKNHVRVFAQLGALRAVVDPNPAALAEARRLYPDVAAYESVEALLKNGGVEAVAVCTPAVTHYALCKQALEAGLDAFVEKPFTLDPAEAAELVELAERKKRVVMVGHLMLYHPGVRRMKELVDSGELGRIHYIYGQRVNLGQVRRDENAMWSLGPHDVSVVVHLFQQTPVRVAAVGSSYIQTQTGVEDVVFLNLMFADGRMANIHLSWLDPHKIRQFTLVGSKKMLVFDDTLATEKLRIYDKGVRGPYNPGQYESYGDALTLHSGDILIPRLDMAEPLKLQDKHFLECVATRNKPLTDGANGLDVVRILSAASRSLAEHGTPIALENVATEGRA
ncbi:MAG: gfo/Idh/MocA family oxidoreductase [Myxococcales bacterium]|nr:MAG: gfo/Idh/MocA family oxidoreductase [Myxococcales bacterium]